MESTTETLVVERELVIGASPETVWEFLVDPDKAIRWMGQAAKLDPRPGGIYWIDVLPGHTARGEFVEVDRPRRLVYTWGWEPGTEGENPVPPGSTTVEVELTPHEAGTALRFTHRDLPSAESAESHGHGWDHYLDRLVRTAAGDDPGSDPWLAANPQDASSG